MDHQTDYEQQVRQYAKEFGGFYNAHAHADRAFTYDDKFYAGHDFSVTEGERLSLVEKQNLVWVLHNGPAFSEQSLRERLTRVLEDSIHFGVRRIDSAVDVTYQTKLKAWEVALALKEQYKGRIDFRLGAYNVSGFKDAYKERFELFEEAAQTADFLVALAEKDNKERKPDHIGERQHNIYMLERGLEFGKPVQFHVGQANSPDDRGAETLFDDMHTFYDVVHRISPPSEPETMNFLVHDISASCYSEDDFKKHLEKLQQFHAGVICCPSAAISMRQKRQETTPTHNSIARVWDYVANGVPVRLGTDNINDIFVPSSSPDMFAEVRDLSNALRFYNPRILTKIACGKELDDFDRGKVRRALF